MTFLQQKLFRIFYGYSETSLILFPVMVGVAMWKRKQGHVSVRLIIIIIEWLLILRQHTPGWLNVFTIMNSYATFWCSLYLITGQIGIFPKPVTLSRHRFARYHRGENMQRRKSRSNRFVLGCIKIWLHVLHSHYQRSHLVARVLQSI